jgi:hypothetical protein
MAEAIISLPLTSKAPIQSEASPFGICVEEVVLGQDSPRVPPFFPVSFIPSVL